MCLLLYINIQLCNYIWHPYIKSIFPFRIDNNNRRLLNRYNINIYYDGSQVDSTTK